jgi:hypothetical protein
MHIANIPIANRKCWVTDILNSISHSTLLSAKGGGGEKSSSENSFGSDESMQSALQHSQYRKLNDNAHLL